jgi:AmmeMemoRadiSam system protein A
MALTHFTIPLKPVTEVRSECLSEPDKQSLLALARESIEAGLERRALAPAPQREVAPTLRAHRAAFVTLYVKGTLRGCVGSIEPCYPLFVEVWRNAAAAAFSDPRFPPLTRAEWPEAALHISVLEPLQPIPASSEQALLERLHPGHDGLVLQLDTARATFLPSVWEQLPAPQDFLTQLKAKAGWPAAFWSPRMQAWRYGTESFGE